MEEINPSNYFFRSEFEEFNESNKKNIENLKKYTTEVKSMLDDIKINYAKSRVTLKDLKSLEDKLINKMMEFAEEINDKFAEKKFVIILYIIITKNMRTIKIN